MLLDAYRNGTGQLNDSLSFHNTADPRPTPCPATPPCFRYSDYHLSCYGALTA